MYFAPSLPLILYGVIAQQSSLDIPVNIDDLFLDLFTDGFKNVFNNFQYWKIERPYQWLQDRLVRNCVRENVIDIKHAQMILKQELKRYNYHQVHSTTQEVPYFRFKSALEEKRSLFRPFEIIPPFKSAKDIFCLRIKRIADA